MMLFNKIIGLDYDSIAKSLAIKKFTEGIIFSG